jgi:hypothetical protein
MPTTLQRLSDRQGLYANSFTGNHYDISNYVNPWTAENATLSITGNDYYVNNRYVMIVSPTGPEDVVLTVNLDNCFSDADNDIQFVFTNVIKSSVIGYSVNSKLYNDITVNALNNSSIDLSHLSQHALPVYPGNSYEPSAGNWKAIRSNIMTYQSPWDQEGNYRGTWCEITISQHNSVPLYISLPNLVIERGWYLNTAMQNTARHMPDFYWNYDAKQLNPRFPFFRFVDVLTSPINDVMQIYADWFEFELNEIPYYADKTTPWALSTLLNYNNFIEKYHPWTFMFVGVPYQKYIYTDANMLTTTESEFLKWQLKTSYLGRAAGTKQALREVVEHVLTGNKLVSITPQYGDDIWAIKLYTLTSETPDVTGEHQESAAVLAAAEMAKPVGYSIIHETLNAITLTLDNSEFGRLDYAQI